MPAGVWFKYLLGQSEAIYRVAASRAALWTGIALVLLTSVARNYDQTHLLENPFLWIFGSLLFSLVSGSWLYAVVYAGFARREMSAPGDARPAEGGGWLSFMGLFWMTAPIAWLYAIPVERFLDSIAATRANVALLALVSLWRVLLMARVIQVTTKAPFLHALMWMMFAASVEVLVVFFFGAGFSKALIASMGGMRNSPEEEIMLETMGAAMFGALWLAPISFVVALVWRPKHLLQSLPLSAKESVRWPALAVAAGLWIAIAFVPQRELANTMRFERLLAAGRAREALDVLASRKPEDFAPARTLPPKPFERSLFTELPEVFGAIQVSDPPWVRELMLSRLDVMVSHAGPGWRRGVDTTQPRDKQVDLVLSGLSWHGPDADGLVKLLSGLQRLPDGDAWLKTNAVFVEAVWKQVTDEQSRQTRSSKAVSPQSWLVLSNLLRDRFITNAPVDSKDVLPARSASPPP
jgi:hypothetical protein